MCVYKEQLHCGGCFGLIQLAQAKLGAKFNWITCFSQLISVSHPAYFSVFLGYFVIECNSQMSIVPRPRSNCSPTPKRELCLFAAVQIGKESKTKLNSYQQCNKINNFHYFFRISRTFRISLWLYRYTDVCVLHFYRNFMKASGKYFTIEIKAHIYFYID